MTPFWGEVIGTMILIVLGLGISAGSLLKRTYAYNAGWITTAIAWGLAVTMGVLAVGNISEAHLNPALTIAFAINGTFPWSDVPIYLAGQMLGAFLGAILVFLHYLPHWKETEDPITKLAVFSTIPAIRHTFSNLLNEILATFMFVLGLFIIGSQGVDPIREGLLVIVIVISLGGTTGALNPARDLGPRIAHFLLPIPGKGDSDWGYAWIPIIGPLLGGALGSVIYKGVFLGHISSWFWIVLGANIFVLLLAYVIGKKSSRDIDLRKGDIEPSKSAS